MWDPGDYIDNHFFQDGMLPMTLDYADYLIDAFLVHHVIDLAVQSDRLTEQPTNWNPTCISNSGCAGFL